MQVNTDTTIQISTAYVLGAEGLSVNLPKVGGGGAPVPAAPVGGWRAGVVAVPGLQARKVAPAQTDPWSEAAPAPQLKRLRVCTPRTLWTVNDSSSLRAGALYFLRSSGSRSVSMISTTEMGCTGGKQNP